MIRSAVWTTLRNLLWSDLVVELNQTVVGHCPLYFEFNMLLLCVCVCVCVFQKQLSVAQSSQRIGKVEELDQDLDGHH